MVHIEECTVILFNLLFNCDRSKYSAFLAIPFPCHSLITFSCEQTEKHNNTKIWVTDGRIVNALCEIFFLPWIEGGGDLDIGFTKALVTNGIIARVSGLNGWGHMIDSKEIMRMSLGCANDTGDVEIWKNLASETSSKCSAFLNKEDLSCQDREGSEVCCNKAINRNWV